MPRVTPQRDPKPTKGRKARKPLSAKAAAEQAERRRKALGVAVRCAAVAVAVGGVLVGYSALSAHVRDTIVLPADDASIRVALADRPAWMADDIAASICERLAEKVKDVPDSRLDPALLDAAVEALEAEPWVQRVGRVSRLDDTLYVACDWRRPAAVVHWPAGRGNVYHLVAPLAEGEGGKDGGGVLLPLAYDDAVAATIKSGEQLRAGGVRLVTGVKVPPPAEPGQTWRSEALAAAIDVALVLQNRPGAEDVTTIDVAAVSTPGLNNTREPRDSCPVVLETRFGTQIYWGRPIRGSDFLVEPSPRVKLENLAEASKRASQNRWPPVIDLRLDRPLP